MLTLITDEQGMVIGKGKAEVLTNIPASMPLYASQIP
jgi:hypothetical protein